MLYNGKYWYFSAYAEYTPSRINQGIEECLLLIWLPACLCAPNVSFSPFASVHYLYNLPSHMMRSEKPRHLRNDFLSVDSSWVHNPAFSDVCCMQQHWTAHLSQPQTPLNAHIHPGPISEKHFGAVAAPVNWHPQKKKSTITILESSNKASEY